MGPKMTFDFEDPGHLAERTFGKILNKQFFIIKVCFPANTDNSGYGNDIIVKDVIFVKLTQYRQTFGIFKKCKK